jgi:L-seryl-tRNA(Ser) seleniumtransferase
MQSPLRQLPSVDKLLQQHQLIPLTQTHGHSLVVEAIRAELGAARQRILAGEMVGTENDLAQGVINRLTLQIRPSLQPVINATGVIIHTNLGRALLSRRAQQAMEQAATAYSNLEYDLEAGARGSRYVHAASLLGRLCGAEAAVVVNNNAAAVILALTALAKDSDVLISRGQLVEIGGGFRIPDIMAQSGARLVEVGTTNRTYVHDFEQAVVPGRTGMLLSVHHSNYQITGFTAQPSLAELAQLARRHQLPLLEDLGSGTLLDTTPFGLAHEPTIQESVAAGVDLVTASGDKLLGGPQAGLILGKAVYIEKLKKHPLIRAFRVDKFTLAALQATLLAYLEQRAVLEIPVWQMIGADLRALSRRANKWRKALQNLHRVDVSVTVVASASTVGGGSLPGQTLPTKAVAISAAALEALAGRLRQGNPPVIARIEQNQLLLDPRTVLPEQDQALIAALTQALQPDQL